MSASELATSVLLWCGVALLLVSVLGVVVMRGVFDKLHYLAPSSVAAVLITVSIMVRESWSLIGMKAILTAVFLLVSGPVLASATARSARIHEHGDWEARPEEGIEVEPK